MSYDVDKAFIIKALECKRNFKKDNKYRCPECVYWMGGWTCPEDSIYDDAIDFMNRACVDCKHYREDSVGSMPGYFICLNADSPTFNRHVDGNFCCAKYEQ